MKYFSIGLPIVTKTEQKPRNSLPWDAGGGPAANPFFGNARLIRGFSVPKLGIQAELPDNSP
jgi:hypothetical protein